MWNDLLRKKFVTKRYKNNREKHKNRFSIEWIES